jgi:Fe-S-cluster containining protein
MLDLAPYRIADAQESADLHRRALGDSIIYDGSFKPVTLSHKFEFDCKRTGKCCRRRGPAQNFIGITSDVRRIKNYCDEHGMVVAGLVHGRVLNLDGYSEKRRPVAYLGGAILDCQFLRENDCSIHPARPTLCATMPIGFIVDHPAKLVALGFQTKMFDICPECMQGPLVSVEDHIRGVITLELIKGMEG